MRNFGSGSNIKGKFDPFRDEGFQCNPGFGWIVHSSCVSGLFSKKVVFRKLGFSELEFEDDCRVLPTCVISALEAKRFSHKGCEAYLAHVIDTSIPKVTLERVPIVQEFSDVFSKDLPRLPLDRELEFGIDLFLELAPIYIPPYRMTPAELKELKT